MNKALIALAGAALLATTGLVAAQDSTTAPSGQTTPETAGAAATSDDAAGQAAPAAGEAAGASGDAAGAAAPAEGDDAAAGAAAEGGEAGESGAEAAAAPSGGSGEKQMAEGEHMQPDAHPSADTQAAGNAVTIGDLGKPMDPAGNPTYNIAEDGTADWYTWRGYKKYGANCLQCHGPDGLGSSFAPNLTESLQNLSYFDFAGIVVSGQQNKWHPVNSVMPAWGEDPNVMCSLDAIYIYLRARADGVVGRGEPPRPEKTDETQAAQEAEYECLGF